MLRRMRGKTVDRLNRSNFSPFRTIHMIKQSAETINRSETTVTGGIEDKAILVAIKEAAQKRQAVSNAVFALIVMFFSSFVTVKYVQYQIPYE